MTNSTFATNATAAILVTLYIDQMDTESFGELRADVANGLMGIDELFEEGVLNVTSPGTDETINIDFILSQPELIDAIKLQLTEKFGA